LLVTNETLEALDAQIIVPIPERHGFLPGIIRYTKTPHDYRCTEATTNAKGHYPKTALDLHRTSRLLEGGHVYVK
jgi:hypothetical protein